MKPQDRTRQPGFTLLEVTVVMGLMIVLLSLGLELYVVTQRGLEVQEAKFEQMRAAREALHALKQDLRSARRVAPGTSATRLVLEVPSLDQAGHVRSGTDTVVYRTETGDPPALIRNARPAAASARSPGDRVIAEGLDTLRFSVEPGGRLVTLTVADERTVHHRTVRLELETAVALRN
jgi:type II secretory pathway pseudopilin PulG